MWPCSVVYEVLYDNLKQLYSIFITKCILVLCGLERACNVA